MDIRKVERQNAKIKLALQGPSGSGKTYSALQIAMGLTELSKICVIDTENCSSDLYAHLGNFNVLDLKKPYSPEKFIQAIDSCVNGGMEVIIIDSLSHEWEGDGGILDIHGQLPGNSFTNWMKVTPRHNALINAILNCGVHVIATLRTKQDYVLTERNGKMVPEKVGLKSITRDGMDYEFTIVFDIDIAHNCLASKDRTGLFVNQPHFKATPETGKKILAWCFEGAISLLQRIQDCEDPIELKELYYNVAAWERTKYNSEFTKRQIELKPTHESNGAVNLSK